MAELIKTLGESVRRRIPIKAPDLPSFVALAKSHDGRKIIVEAIAHPIPMPEYGNGFGDIVGELFGATAYELRFTAPTSGRQIKYSLHLSNVVWMEHGLPDPEKITKANAEVRQQAFDKARDLQSLFGPDMPIYFKDRTTPDATTNLMQELKLPT